MPTVTVISTWTVTSNSVRNSCHSFFAIFWLLHTFKAIQIVPHELFFSSFLLSFMHIMHHSEQLKRQKAIILSFHTNLLITFFPQWRHKKIRTHRHQVIVHFMQCRQRNKRKRTVVHLAITVILIPHSALPVITRSASDRLHSLSLNSFHC